METRALITMTTNNIQIIIYYYCLYVVIIYRIMANWKETNSHTTQKYIQNKR